MTSGEHRAVGSDRQREGEHGDERERRCATQCTCAVAQILSEPLEPNAATDLSRLFLDVRDVAELQSRRALGRFSRLAASHSVGDRHAQMRRELVVDLVVTVGAVNGFHVSLSFGTFMMPAMALEICSQRDRSDESCFFPAAVRR